MKKRRSVHIAPLTALPPSAFENAAHVLLCSSFPRKPVILSEPLLARFTQPRPSQLKPSFTKLFPYFYFSPSIPFFSLEMQLTFLSRVPLLVTPSSPPPPLAPSTYVHCQASLLYIIFCPFTRLPSSLSLTFFSSSPSRSPFLLSSSPHIFHAHSQANLHHRFLLPFTRLPPSFAFSSRYRHLPLYGYPSRNPFFLSSSPHTFHAHCQASLLCNILYPLTRLPSSLSFHSRYSSPSSLKFPFL